MELHISEEALEAIRKRRQPDGLLKLAYDNEGCGCAVNGMPSLWLVQQAGPSDEPITTNAPFSVIADRHHMIYFEDVMKLDIQSNGDYRLSSNQQIYSAHMSCIDKQSV